MGFLVNKVELTYLLTYHRPGPLVKGLSAFFSSFASEARLPLKTCLHSLARVGPKKKVKPPVTFSLGGAIESEVSRSYNSLSGSDMRAVLGHTPFAELQAISYSVTREKAPIYTMGSPDVRSFS